MNQDFQKLLNSVLRFIGIRLRSRQEIVNYLHRKTLDQDLTHQILEKLEKTKLIDDFEFAKWYIASRSRSRPRSRWLLETELKRKGISPDIINENLATRDDDLTLATRALAKKSHLWNKLSKSEFKRKASLFLRTRGFPHSVIEPVIKTAYNHIHVN